jgi:hypothetical protein
MTIHGVVPVGPGSALTSWVQSDGPHVVYADANGGLRQIWYTVSTGQWAAQSLMTVAGMVPAGPSSGMTSWVQQSDGPHVVYTDAGGNLRQIWYTISTGQWAAQSLMNVPNAVPARPGSPMTAWFQYNRGPRAYPDPYFAYVDAKGHVQQRWYAVGTGQWQGDDVTALAGSPQVGPAGNMISWVESGIRPHILFADAGGHVQHLQLGGHWTSDDLTNQLNFPPIPAGNAITRWGLADGLDIVYGFLSFGVGDPSPNLHLEHLSYTISSDQWALQDLSTSTRISP